MNDHAHPEQESPYSNDGTPERTTRRRSTPGPFGRLNPEPGDAYRATFTANVKRDIVNQVRVAYNDAQENHDESCGFNATTFGHNVYHLAKFRLTKLSESSGGAFNVVGEIGGLFRMQGGEYSIGVYKVGSSAKNNIWESFPTTENGANPGNNEGQPFFDGFELSMLDDVTARRYVVVAHLGNPTDGLVAVYLCIPIEKSQGKITRWGYAEQIFSGEDVLGTIPAELDIPHPAEEPEKPIVPTLHNEEPEGEVVVTAINDD